MDANTVLQNATAIVALFSRKKKPLQEFELLAYEQACCTIECTLKIFRETWEMLHEKELKKYTE